jgi:hypothetical protein
MKSKHLLASLLVLCALLLGCKKQISHTPSTNVPADLKGTLYKMLAEQQGFFHAPLETAVADDAFSVTWQWAQGLIRTVTIYYVEVATIDIVLKRGTYAVHIKYADGNTQYFYLTTDEQKARQFVDILAALKQRAQSLPTAPAATAPVAIPSVGCSPPCSPGYQCVDVVCQPLCNPPCGEGMICAQDRTCQPAPPSPPPPAPAP